MTDMSASSRLFPGSWRLRTAIALSLSILAALFINRLVRGSDSGLERGWSDPPNEARVRAYWWWLNSNVTRASITHDLEEMKAKGFGGAVLFDAGGAEQEGNAPVPHGPTFFSPQWRELYKHTLREGDRLGMEISLNIQSGWNLGGPMVRSEDAAKKLVWSESTLSGPAKFSTRLPEPNHKDPYYHDLMVVAFRVKVGMTEVPAPRTDAKKRATRG